MILINLWRNDKFDLKIIIFILDLFSLRKKNLIFSYIFKNIPNFRNFQ